jgi:hypothetical protein
MQAKIKLCLIIMSLIFNLCYAAESNDSGTCINAAGGKVSDELKDLCLTKEDLEKKK